MLLLLLPLNTVLTSLFDVYFLGHAHDARYWRSWTVDRLQFYCV